MFDSPCYCKTIKTREEVNEFLGEVKKLLDESSNNLRIEGRTNSEDKTHDFMYENGIERSHISEQIKQLDIISYSYTDKDKDFKKPGNVWIFGQMFIIEEEGKFFEIYIKLKLSRIVICLSFHPKEFDIVYPYL